MTEEKGRAKRLKGKESERGQRNRERQEKE